MSSWVDGEAPETDDSDDEYLFNLSYMKIGVDSESLNPNVATTSSARDMILKGAIVDGATEIDDLINTPVAAEATEEYIPAYIKPPTCTAEFFYENELVRKKMNEVSSSILSDFIQGTVANASKQLIEADQVVINTQNTLTNTSTTMSKINHTTSKISEKFHNLMDSNFLPNMRQPKKLTK
ncbi:unnamed protein product [Diamesa serratosioi]